MLYVYKSMLNKLQNEGRNSLIFILLIIMMAALFFSRAALSVSMISFVAVSFFHKDTKKQFHEFLGSPLLWGMSLLFFLPLLSGLWSEEGKAWTEILRIKLPLLFLPVAFAAPFKFSQRQWEWLAYCFMALITAGTIWSMYHYVANAAVINESYLQAKSLVTPLENDHVRFSWLISVAILTGGILILIKKHSQKRIALVLAIIILWLIIFLHLLAARTGLFSLYIILLTGSLWLIFKRWNPASIGRPYGVLLLILLAASPFVAYKTLPTFQNRVKYILHDFGYFKEAHYLQGANDAVRIISLKAGYSLIKEYPLRGTGFGDLNTATRKWYDLHYPQMAEPDKIFPSSEWLIYGAACGIPGFLVFSLVMIIPFFIKTKAMVLWRTLNLITAFSFLFDIGLEVQFGVFIYAFIILVFWKWVTYGIAPDPQ